MVERGTDKKASAHAVRKHARWDAYSQKIPHLIPQEIMNIMVQIV